MDFCFEFTAKAYKKLKRMDRQAFFARMSEICFLFFEKQQRYRITKINVPIVIPNIKDVKVTIYAVKYDAKQRVICSITPNKKSVITLKIYDICSHDDLTLSVESVSRDLNRSFYNGISKRVG